MNALAIPDLHIPFEHPESLDFVRLVDKTFFPDKNRRVVFLGDEIDSHSISRYMPDPNGKSPRDELEYAKLRLKDWFKAFPKAFICTSNHTVRPWKKAFEVGLPHEFMRSIAEVYEAPIGWKWADKWIFDNIVFEHGENVSGALGALKAAQQNHKNTVIGHLHTFGGAIHADFDHGKLWGLNTGCLIDTKAYAFHYAKTLRNKPTLGMGIIKNGQPYFIPMIIKGNGRWIKTI